MLLLLDIQKAFDSKGWNFIRSVLIQYGFPQYFITWFEIFYTGKELHVINDGHLSEVIFPSRGVTQGCGISPLYFILSLEVLALAIRDDPQIIGMSVLDSIKKINLLADDGLLVLCWAQQSFDAVVEILQEFGEISNLQVNKHKSVIVKIGSHRLSRVELQGTEHFKRSNDGSFQYLGIDWRVDGKTHRAMSNFITEREQIMSIAHARNDANHSLLGRILNVKSLMTSKLIYKFKGIPSPTKTWLHELQSQLNNYIWSNAYHHIRAEQTYLPINKGGLGMLSIILQEKSYKLGWLDVALHNDRMFWCNQLKSCLSIPLRELYCSNIRPGHLKYVCSPQLPVFWNCVLKYWCESHYVTTGSNVALMPLAYNSALASTRRPLLFKEYRINRFHTLGVYTVKDFIEMYDTWSKTQRSSLEATHIMNAMPDNWLTQVDSDNFGELPPLEKLLLVRPTARVFYNELVKLMLQKENCRIIKWQQELNCTDLDAQWNRICSISSQIVQIKMRTFYLRYINRAYMLGPRRSKFMSVTAMCSLCNNAEETFAHVF